MKKPEQNPRQWEQVLSAVLRVLIAGFFSIIAVSQILGVLNLYRAPLVYGLSSVVFVMVLYFWGKSNTIILDDETQQQSQRNWVAIAGYAGGMILLVLVMVALSRWPAIALPWDAGEYHYAKAGELYRSGSANDFTISYGDYPFGYESTLSLILLLTQNPADYGYLHVVIAVFFLLAFWTLARRYSSLPAGLLFFLCVFLCLSGFISFFNPWQSLRYTLFTVGKNDLLLAAATIAAIAYSRFGIPQKSSHDLMGLSLATAIAMSVKPNSALILLLLWADVMAVEWKQKASWNAFLRQVIPTAALSLVGLIWLVRNLIGFGAVFNPLSYRIVSWSIWSNLLNPAFYRNIPNSLLLVVLILLLSVGLSFLKSFRRFLWRESLLFGTLLFSFILTPASAAQQDPSQIAWRFGTALLVQEFCLLLLILDRPLAGILNWIEAKKALYWASSILIILLAGGFLYWQSDLLRAAPQNAWPLERPYQDTEAPYLSVFDYIDENIHNAVIWVEGAQSHYAYDPDFTNSVTRSQPADYIVAVNRTIDQLWITEADWSVLYQDRYGTIYQPKP